MDEVENLSTLPMEDINSQELDGALADNPQSNTSWGRLLSLKGGAAPYYLNKPKHAFGRSADADFLLQNLPMSSTVLQACSKIHFTITAEETPRGDIITLCDNSSNGTFINGVKVGKGHKQVLIHNDEISVSHHKNRVFVFLENSANGNGYPSDLIERFVVTNRVLGKGAQGEVRLVFDKRNNKEYAMKIVEKKKFSSTGMDRAIQDNIQITREIDILRRLDHPCVVGIVDVFDNPETAYIVMELAEAGELFDRITEDKRDGKGLGEKLSKFYFYQLFKAIKYLHSMSVTHRDLKPENVLLNGEEDYCLVKITDFGLSKLMDAGTMLKTYCGTPNYLAPEILKSWGGGSYTEAVDLWSLGVILFISLSGYPPFSKDYHDMDLNRQILTARLKFNEDKWQTISPQARDLVKQLLKVDPSKRITVNDALSHSWFQDSEMRSQADSMMASHERNKEARSPKKRSRALQLTSNDVSMMDVTSTPPIKSRRE